MYSLIDSDIDNRDYVYANICGLGRNSIPPRFINNYVKVEQQSNSMKCVGFGVSTLMESKEMMRLGVRNVKNLSPQFAYYMAKTLDGLSSREKGTTLAAMCKAMNKYGICEETLMKFVEDGDLLSGMKAPTQEAIINAEKRKISGYARCYDLDSIKQGIYNEGGVLLSMLYYSDMLHTKNGFMAEPNWKSSKLGNHCVALIGYDDNYEKVINGIRYKGFFVILNSYGEDQGNKGLEYVPYDMLNWVGGQYKYTSDKIFREAWVLYDDKNVNHNKFNINNQPKEVIANAKPIHMEIKLGSKCALVNGEKLVFDQPMVEKCGYMFAPVRFFADVLDCDVFYKDMNGRAFVRLTDKNTGARVDMTESWNYNYVDGKEYYCVQPPFLEKSTNRLLLGLRDLCTMLGCDVKWNKDTRIATITR